MFFIDLMSWSQLQVGNQYSSENAIQGIEDKKFSIASTSQLSSSQNLLNQRHHLDSSSPSNITSESYPEKFGPPSGSFAQRNSKGNIRDILTNKSFFFLQKSDTNINRVNELAKCTLSDLFQYIVPMHNCLELR